MSLDDIRDAIAGADREAVEALLNAEDSDLDAFSVNALFGMCVLAAAQSQSRNESRHLLEIGRLLVARGARADGPLGNEPLLQSPLVMPITSLNACRNCSTCSRSRSAASSRIAPYSAFGRSYLGAAPHSGGGEAGEERAAATRKRSMPSLSSSNSETTASSGTSSPSGKRRTKKYNTHNYHRYRA